MGNDQSLELESKQTNSQCNQQCYAAILWLTNNHMDGHSFPDGVSGSLQGKSYDKQFTGTPHLTIVIGIIIFIT